MPSNLPSIRFSRAKSEKMQADLPRLMTTTQELWIFCFPLLSWKRKEWKEGNKEGKKEGKREEGRKEINLVFGSSKRQEPRSYIRTFLRDIANQSQK